MRIADKYVDLKGREISLKELTDAERTLIADMMVAADTATDWSDFSNLGPMRVAALYKNLTRAKVRHSVAYRVCQDLDSRFAVSRGLARRSDYRDELASLIEQPHPRHHRRKALATTLQTASRPSVMAALVSGWAPGRAFVSSVTPILTIE